MSYFDPGWIPDSPDPNDKIFMDTLYKDLAALSPNTTSSSLETPKIPSDHQYDFGSCTAHAVALAIRYGLVLHTKQPTNGSPFVPARLWIWYWGKWFGAEDTKANTGDAAVRVSGGSAIRDSIKSLYKKGCPPEKLWAYPTGFKVGFVHPENSKELKKEFWEIPKVALEAARKDYAAFNLEYFRIKIKDENTTNEQHQDKTQDPPSSEVSRVTQIKHCIAEGYPVIFGIAIFMKTQKDPATNQLAWVDTWNPMSSINMAGDGSGRLWLRNPPQHPEGGPGSGHAMVVVSFDDGIQNVDAGGKLLQTKGAFEVQNSWGSDLERYWIPYEYFEGTTWVKDIWVIKVKGFENDPHGKGSHGS